jgi:hypothetical protein
LACAPATLRRCFRWNSPQRQCAEHTGTLGKLRMFTPVTPYASLSAIVIAPPSRCLVQDNCLELLDAISPFLMTNVVMPHCDSCIKRALPRTGLPRRGAYIPSENSRPGITHRPCEARLRFDGAFQDWRLAGVPTAPKDVSEPVWPLLNSCLR